MRRAWRFFSLLLLLSLSIMPVSAQRDGDDTPDLCPAIVESALTQTAEVCAELGRNEICYGHDSVEAEGEAAVIEAFTGPGDLTALASISTLRTAALNTESEQWGIALMAVQANLPDALPGENVRFVVFGDTQIETDDSASGFDAPMQAFRISTGFGALACDELPPDGLLVQAPRGTTVNFLVNGVEVTVGSTGFITMLNEDELEVSTLDGTISVSAAGESVTIEPGNWTQITTGLPPEPVKPYDYNLLRRMPVDLLPDAVNIPITVKPFYQWQETGRQLSAGDTFTVEASGTVDLWIECEAQREAGDIDADTDCEQVSIYGPDGANYIVTQADQDQFEYPFVGQYIGALMARIGEEGEPFLVGSGGTFTADRDGTLQFFINDDPTPDNSGGYVVTLTVNPGSTDVAPPPPPPAPADSSTNAPPPAPPEDDDSDDDDSDDEDSDDDDSDDDD